MDHSVECVDLDGAAARAASWRDLCSRALEANAFAEPSFVLNCARHLAPGRLEFLFAWQDASRRRLVGVMAIEPPRLGVAQVWQSDQAALAAIALDRDEAAAAFDSAAEWLRRERPRIAGLFVPTLAEKTGTASLLEEFAKRRAFAFSAIAPRQRAVLLAVGGKRARLDDLLPGKRLKEWRRLRRRLEERGPLVFRSAEEAETPSALEAFLTLETKSWKGRNGAPLGADEARARFARTMTAAMSSEGKLRFDALELAGQPIAMGVILFAKDRAFYWKTAYDEAFADFSPGVLLTLDISRRQQDDRAVAATDSCAIAGHPMIDRLWPQRLALVDCLVAIGPGGASRLRAWRAQSELGGRLKDVAKRLVYPLIGRKRS